MTACEYYPTTDTDGADGRPRTARGPVCLQPCTGQRCADHVGMVTGADRLEAADDAVDPVARLRAQMMEART